MKNIIKTIFLGSVLILALYFCFFGIRDVTLRQMDCKSCRRIFSLFAQPRDYNAPAAIVKVIDGRARVYLFSKYAGPYFVEAYEVNADIELEFSKFECEGGIKFVSYPGPKSHRKVFSAQGRGETLGAVFFHPKNVGTKQREICEIEMTSPANFLLVISRASEN